MAEPTPRREGESDDDYRARQEREKTEQERRGAATAVEGDTYPTNEVGAMVPNINRIPGERDYDPADELKPVYDKATSQPEPYKHPNYMSTEPDLTNPNDLAHPDNPANKPAGQPAFDPYATPVEGAAVPPATSTTYR